MVWGGEVSAPPRLRRRQHKAIWRKPVTGLRRFAAIDDGMADYIQQLTGCSRADVPDALECWMRCVAKGAGSR